MRYVVMMNNKYMNSFRYYGDAVDLKDKLDHQHPNAKIEIITYDEFKREIV